MTDTIFVKMLLIEALLFAMAHTVMSDHDQPAAHRRRATVFMTILILGITSLAYIVARGLQR